MFADPAVRFANEFRDWYAQDVYPTEKRLNQEITLLYRDYMRGQMEFEPKKAFFPDANLTLRVAYGSISGYSPADGAYYKPQSTLEGIMQKDNPEISTTTSLRDSVTSMPLRITEDGQLRGQWPEDSSGLLHRHQPYFRRQFRKPCHK